jgi:hypothetical protein
VKVPARHGPPQIKRHYGLAPLLAALTLPLLAGTAEACSCAARSEEEIIRSADAVFSGTVARISRRSYRGPSQVLVTIQVRSKEKGSVQGNVVVGTAGDPAACGITFIPGAKVRIAATNGERGLVTNLCMTLAPR